ncbi:hypothetical protein D3C79_734020 [compost metagenome]
MLHALFAATFGVEQARLIELGVQVVFVLLPGQFAAALEAMFGSAQYHRVLLQQVLRQRHGGFTQLRQRYAFIDQAHLGGFLPAKGLTGHDVVQRLTMPDGVGHGFADQVAWRNAPVDFRQAEGRLVGTDGQVARYQRAEATAEAPAVDHGDGRLGVHAQQLPLPLRGFTADFFLKDFGAGVDLAEVFLQVHACSPRLTGPGQHQHAGVSVLLQGFQHVDHFPVQGGAHGIAFFRAIEGHPGDARFQFDLHGGPAAFIFAHGSALLLFEVMGPR